MTKIQILNEIRRTAQANGGVPLGWRKFSTETGIREGDWKGKLWARWSDAIREAGLAPNQLKQAYPETKLLEKYAAFAIRLGRLPAVVDVRLAIHNGLEFPNWRTLVRPFGGFPRMLLKLREHCGARQELAAVVEMCEAFTRQHADQKEPTASSDRALGYVYLIRHGARREYKIGRTNNALRREGEIAIELPERVQPVHVIRTDDPAGIEAYWHGRFADRRKNGEWFQLDAADVAAFKRRKFM